MGAEQFKIHAESELTHWWFLARRNILQKLIAVLVANHARGNIVDIGSGTGANAAAFAELAPVVGIDVSHFATQLARERFPSVHFQCGELAALPKTLGEAQVVTMLDVLEHVPDDFHFFSEAVSMTEPGTYFIVTVPAEMELWSPHDEALGHYRRYSRDRLQMVWDELPVRCLMLTGLNSRLYWPIRLARTWNRWRRRSLGKGNDLSSLPPLLNDFLRRMFQGEDRRIMRCLNTGGKNPYARGVSLLAVLRRDEGEISPRCRPASIPPDPFDPIEGNSESG